LSRCTNYPKLDSSCERLSSFSKVLLIDFNSWEIVKKVPVGNVKDYEVEDGKITVKIGL
jgi:hypothetical protein